ncbi:hypothetical protein ACE3MZ_21425 [Paenibacillus sp. WLX1005]|uniref:hypothetical protein n=1 Tax=unclassified Paenibacillus TaxID=185978 RepID=UPI0039843C02
MLNFPLYIALEHRVVGVYNIAGTFYEDGRSLSKNEYFPNGEMPLLPSASVGFSAVYTL